MNSRQIFSTARTLLARKNLTTGARNSSAYKPPASWYEPSLNELPIPQGSWQAAYDAQQKKSNLHLIAGVSWFIFTMVVWKTSGLVELNSQIPPLPEDE